MDKLEKIPEQYVEMCQKLSRVNMEFYLDQSALQRCINDIKNKTITDMDIHTARDDNNSDVEVVKVCMVLKDLKSNKIQTFKQLNYSFVRDILRDYCEQHGINVYHN